MKISSVSISGMHHIMNKTYNFSDVNYLHGANGAGKSTVLNAIQLAILGYIPGTAKQTSAIFQHSSNPEMKIVVTFDNGRIIERKWNTKGRTVETHLSGNFSPEELQELIKDLELPIFNFEELVGLTANKLKDWFINFLPSNSIIINWEDELKNCLGGLEIMDEELFRGALDLLQADSDRTLIEKIQAFNTAMKSNQSYLKSELSRAESTIQSLIYYDEEGLIGDAEYLDGEIKRSQDKISQLTADKENLIRSTQIKISNQQIQDQIDNITVIPEDEIDSMQTKFNELSKKVFDLQAQVVEGQNQQSRISSKISTLKYQISSKTEIINSGGICPYTKDVCSSIQAKIESLKAEIASIEDEMTSLAAQYTEVQADTRNKIEEVKNLTSESQRLQNEIMQARNAQVNITRLKSMLQVVPEVQETATLNFYDSEILHLNQQISKIQANKKYNALVDKLTADKYKIENSIEVLKCWVKLTDPNGLQTKVMDAPFKNLATEMDKYLSIMFAEEIRCNFNLEQRANSFSFGILRGKKYIPYDLLSSGEKTMYALALMICIVNKTSSPLKLLIVDDMLDHLDNNRANEVFNALSRIEDIQIILAGVKESDNAKAFMIEVTR